MEIQEIIDLWLSGAPIPYESIPNIIRSYFKDVKKSTMTEDLFQQLRIAGLESLIDMDYVLESICIARNIIIYKLYDQSGRLIKRYV